MKSAQFVLFYYTDCYVLRGVQVFKLSVLPIVSSVSHSFAKSGELLLSSTSLLNFMFVLYFD